MILTAYFFDCHCASSLREMFYRWRILFRRKHEFIPVLYSHDNDGWKLIFGNLMPAAAERDGQKSRRCCGQVLFSYISNKLRTGSIQRH